MTHEYVIALHGRIETNATDQEEPQASAIAWAADHVLAVGSDDVVRAISRGDSTFVDLAGCVVTALPSDPAAADALISVMTPSATPAAAIRALLIKAGLLLEDSVLEPGSPADLAFWDAGSRPDGTGNRPARGLVAVVRGGGFTEGDEHQGPFPIASSP
jgi:hypothetical protein